jgi:hypothetical protein
MATSMYNWYATQPTVYLLAGYPRYAMIATCEIFIPQLEFGPEVVWLRERVCSHTLGWCRGPGGLEEAGETWLVGLKLGHIPPNHSAMIVYSHWPLEIMHLSLETFWGPLSVIDRDQDCANIVTTDVQPWTILDGRYTNLSPSGVPWEGTLRWLLLNCGLFLVVVLLAYWLCPLFCDSSGATGLPSGLDFMRSIYIYRFRN